MLEPKTEISQPKVTSIRSVTLPNINDHTRLEDLSFNKRGQLIKLGASYSMPLNIADIMGKASLDFNPAHFSDEYMAQSILKSGKIGHGVAFQAEVFGLFAAFGLVPVNFRIDRFSSPTHPGDDLLINLERNGLQGNGSNWETPRIYSFKVDCLNRTTDKPTPIVDGFEVQAMTPHPAFFRSLEDTKKRKEASKKMSNLLPEEEDGKIHIYTNDGTYLDYLPPIAEIKPGYKFGTRTSATMEMAEAVRESSAGIKSMAELLPPFSVSRLLASMGGEGGLNATMIFLSLTGELAAGNRDISFWSPYATVLQVESNKPNPKRVDVHGIPLIHSISCSYEVRSLKDSLRGRLLSRGTASVMAARWPYPQI